MSVLQEQATQMIRRLFDDNVCFLIEVIQRLVAPKDVASPFNAEAMHTFFRLNSARDEIAQYLPDDFDPDKELMEARVERYGNFD